MPVAIFIPTFFSFFQIDSTYSVCMPRVCLLVDSPNSDQLISNNRLWSQLCGDPPPNRGKDLKTEATSRN